MKTITVLTATRAEYGLLKPLILALIACNDFTVRVVVTGAHLSPEFGLTYKEILNDGIDIDEKIDILLSSDTPAAISKSMGLATISFGDYFERKSTDALVVLGDRYETLSVCCAAMNARIPIIHIHGGETTEGAVDEAIRHSISKMSYLHLVSAEEFRKRVIQLGEQPDKVYNVGALGVENVMNVELLTKEELEDRINFKLDKPYAVVTFHPVTLEDSSAAEQCKELLEALDLHSGNKYIITKANADADGRVINKMIDEYSETHDNVFVIQSLGLQRYLSAVKYADMVIGNSSSGLIEVPSFGIPTVNIGDRQKGRLRADSVLDCFPTCESISETMYKAQDLEFRKFCQSIKSPYGDGNTSAKMVEIIKKHFLSSEVSLKKKFYDIEF